MGSGRTLRVLVVDDSAVARQVFQSVLAAEPDFTVEVAANPAIAAEQIRRHRPDVILLDLEMPGMDGIAFLRRLMEDDPLPVVVCSAHAGRGSEAALRALELGAVAVLPKPHLGMQGLPDAGSREIRDALRGAGEASVRRSSPRPTPPEAPPLPPGAPGPRPSAIVIGASTGGPEALHALLRLLPDDAPPVVVAQHMPREFTAAFARRLDETSGLAVREAASGELLCPGQVLVAPGGRQTALARRPEGVVVEVREADPGERHRPSVDLLFQSAASVLGGGAVGVILTGMGADGAAGLLEIRRAGGRTLAQDEESCVVFGMPREALLAGAIDEMLPLLKIPERLLQLSRPV